MDIRQEAFCLNKLEQVLKDAPVSHYKVGGSKEDAVCLVHEDRWQVFTIERGRRYEEETFSDIADAAAEMIKRVFEDESHIECFRALIAESNKQY